MTRVVKRYAFVALASKSMTDIKSQILHYAIPKMQQVGIRSVSVDDICHELGISKKTFYVYFPSKDDLVDAILCAANKKLATDVQSIVIKKTVVECIVEWHNVAKKTEKNACQTPPVLYDLQKYYPNLYKTHQKRLRTTMHSLMVQFLEKGQSEGIFRSEIDTEMTSQLFVNVNVDMAELARKKEMTEFQIRQYGRQVMDVLLRGIFTPEGLVTLEQKVKG